MVVAELVRVLEHVAAGAISSFYIGTLLLPLVAVVGSISLLIAILATVGVFLRFCTASLSEIQLRMAALEERFLAQSESVLEKARIVLFPDTVLGPKVRLVRFVARARQVALHPH